MSYLGMIILAVVALAVPSQALAFPCTGQIRSFSDVVCFFLDLIETAIPVVAAIALLVFFWGLGKLILHAGDQTGREEGKQIMKWGIIALFVLVSIWGIIAFLSGDIFGRYFIGIPQLPTI